MSLDVVFKVSKICAIPNVSLFLCLVFVDQNVSSQLLVWHHVCHAPHHDSNRLILRNYKF